jgi:(2Fe-2S) ferredoxin
MQMSYYQYHLFFCVNQKENGKKCCASGGAHSLYEYARSRIKALDLHGQEGVRVSHSGCLGRCSAGPNLLIYPDGVWYNYQNEADIDEIIATHLMKGEIIPRLLVDNLG